MEKEREKEKREKEREMRREREREKEKYKDCKWESFPSVGGSVPLKELRDKSLK